MTRVTHKLSLKRANKDDRLADFIAQEEAAGVGPVDEAELLEAIKATVKPPQSKDRTSHFASRGGSAEK